MKRLPGNAIPALKLALQPDGTFTDQDFIRSPGIGRVTLGRLVELGWAKPIQSEAFSPRKYELTQDGRDAINAHQPGRE